MNILISLKAYSGTLYDPLQAPCAGTLKGLSDFQKELPISARGLNSPPKGAFMTHVDSFSGGVRAVVRRFSE